ncbi:MAG: DNA mismatch repair endonuclease MutL [Bacteroidales bacterium]|nr:DNA mismatch repair endonuclease MutL [Bacteroidales bacterium]
MLRVLPANISNLIAAGEVVQRPASVVKELMENAVDAGAKNISVIILDAGKTLIQVIDDGCGMTSDEAKLCFERHATSKITTADDLEHIMTYGFRGEALASVAAISEVTLKTRKADSEIGTHIEITGSKIVNEQPVSIPVGSNFAVRNIFFNVPARRKFLKTDAAELRHITSEFTKVALTRENISFKLTHNNKDIYNLKSVPNQKQRILESCGKEIIKELVDVNTETSVIKISGFVGKPEDARKTLGNQYLFINGRYFKSPYINKAICKPYENLISNGYTPSYFIFLETDPEKIDVNIHPAKTEIKFEDDSMIFEIVFASVREALGKNSFLPSIDFDREGVPEIPIVFSGKGEYIPPPKIDYNPLFNPFDSFTSPSKNYGQLFEEEAVSQKSSLILVQGKYIITPVKSGILVINISRARERILYEKYLELIIEDQAVIQESLFPQTLELNHDQYSFLMEDLNLLNKLGFDIRDFGNNSVVIYGLPTGFPADTESVKKSIDTLISIMQEEKIDTDNKSNLAISMAKSAALSYKNNMNDNQAQILVDQLFACRDSSTTPDGRKCMSIISIEELEKKL